MHAITRMVVKNTNYSGIFKKLSIQIFRESYRLELTFLGGILAKRFSMALLHTITLLILLHYLISYLISISYLRFKI